MDPLNLELIHAEKVNDFLQQTRDEKLKALLTTFKVLGCSTLSCFGKEKFQKDFQISPSIIEAAWKIAQIHYIGSAKLDFEVGKIIGSSLTAEMPFISVVLTLQSKTALAPSEVEEINQGIKSSASCKIFGVEFNYSGGQAMITLINPEKFFIKPS